MRANIFEAHSAGPVDEGAAPAPVDVLKDLSSKKCAILDGSGSRIFVLRSDLTDFSNNNKKT